jgi:RimJ/RimL family protein N-acetyltransferase
MPGAAFLRGERVTLRTVQPEDYEFVHEHWNDPSIRYGAPMPTPISEEDIAGFVEEVDDAIQFLPCRDRTPVGFVMLFDIDAEASHAELGYWVVPDERGAGYATAAADLCLTHAFDDRGLHKVLARVFEGNEASIRVLEKLGFEREGQLRQHRYVNGEHVDVHLYGMTASEHR